MPTGWYELSSHRPGGGAAGVDGLVLWRLALLIEGFVVLVVAVRRTHFVSMEPATRPPLPGPPVSDGWDVSPRVAAHALIAITALALALRLIGINTDLWIDEVAPMMEYGAYSVMEVLTTFTRSSNHLLNTLLVKAVTAVAGEREWAVRLPAVLFGVASIPAMYWVARLAMNRAASLSAALLLAVSYHHVFFSQNARGYSGYLLFSILGTGLLVRGVQQDRLRDWVLYATVMVLDFASLLHAWFVFAAHVLVGAALAVLAWRSGRAVAPTVRRMVAVFGITGFLGFHLYAAMLVQAYGVLNQTYASPSSGFQVTSRGFLADLLRGLSEGFGGGLWLGLLPFVALAPYGGFKLLRRNWVIATALALPLVLLAGLVAIGGLAASPRFFLLALPVADLAVVLSVFGISEHLGRLTTRRRTAPAIAVALILLVSAASLASLPPYYRVPKQPYRQTLEFVRAQAGGGDLVIFVHNAEKGFRFYSQRAGMVEGRDFVVARSLTAFDAATMTRRGVVVVTTLERSLALEVPDLYRRIRAGWVPQRHFPATIHDGGTTVWRARMR